MNRRFFWGFWLIISCPVLSAGPTSLGVAASAVAPKAASAVASEVTSAVAPKAVSDSVSLESVASVSVAASDTFLLTVDALFEKGVAQSLKLQADRIEEERARIRWRQARQKRLPDIQLALKGGYVGPPTVWKHGLSDASHPDAPDWSQNYEVSLIQPLYEGGRIRNRVDQAAIAARLSALQTQTDRAEIKLMLIRHYLDLFTLHRQLDVFSRNVHEAEVRLKDVRQLYREGVVTYNDVLRSELQLTNSRLSLTDTQNALSVLSQQLDIYLGLDESLILQPDTALLSQRMVLPDSQEAVQTAYTGDPALLLQQEQTRMARAQLKEAHLNYRPSVSLYAGNTLARPVSRTLQDIYNNNWHIGLSVSYSLSALYQNKNLIRDKQQAVQWQQNQEEQIRQQIRMNLQQIRKEYATACAQLQAMRLSVRQARENYRIMENQYRNQMAILTDLLDANNVLLQAELQWTIAQTRVILAYYEMEKACGRL